MAHSKRTSLPAAAAFAAPAVIAAVVVASLAALPAPARAGDSECFYNGRKPDERLGKPEHFTGEYTCKDTGTGKVVLRQHQVDGVVEGESTKLDARTGKVEEVVHYLHGHAHGTKRQYTDGVLDFEWAYVGGKRAGVQRDMKDGVLAKVYLMSERDGQADTSLYFNKKGQLTMLECGKHAISKRDFVWCGRDGAQSTVSLYDDEGRVRATEQYQWGQAHGVFKKLDPATGKPVSEQRFEKGQAIKNGKRLYDAQGALLIKTDCDDKRASCTETELFADGKQRRMITIWKAGRVAKQTSYFQNGNLDEELERLPAGDRFAIKVHYDSGQLESKGTYILAEDWYWRSFEPDGVVESFASDGTLVLRETYRKGRLFGPLQRFWVREDKRMREDSEYDNDNLLKQKIFENDILSAENEYFPDGSVKSHKDHTGATGPRI